VTQITPLGSAVAAAPRAQTVTMTNTYAATPKPEVGPPPPPGSPRIVGQPPIRSLPFTGTSPWPMPIALALLLLGAVAVRAGRTRPPARPLPRHAL
jgi:hypothetical protein